jgi:hypothetical protein
VYVSNSRLVRATPKNKNGLPMAIVSIERSVQNSVGRALRSTHRSPTTTDKAAVPSRDSVDRHAETVWYRRQTRMQVPSKGNGNGFARVPVVPRQHRADRRMAQRGGHPTQGIFQRDSCASSCSIGGVAGRARMCLTCSRCLCR